MSEVARAAAAIYRMDWRGMLIVNKGGDPRPLLANALTALRSAPEWHNVLAFDEFAVKIKIQKPTPWGKMPGEQWIDNDDRLTAEWLQKEGIAAATNLAGEAVQTVAMEFRIHPVRDYLVSLKWDGIPRLDTWLSKYLGVDPSKSISLAFGRLWAISAVARVLDPGCKADCCLILEGPQGIGKSTSLRALSTPWFTDQLAEIGSKDASMQCHGVWVIELAELDSINRSETSRIKAFMSATVDRFRLPYGKHVGEWPRGCVFAGSTNKDDYLRDETGGRRFWPVVCTSCNVTAIERDRNQLWAEAVILHREGKQWWLSDSRSIRDAESEQADRLEGDAWDERLAAFLAGQSDVSTSEFLSKLGKPEGQWTRGDEMRVAQRLKAIGWTRYRSSLSGRPWRYRCPNL